MTKSFDSPSLEWFADRNVELCSQVRSLEAELAKQRDENSRVTAEGMVERYAKMAERYADLSERLITLMERGK